MTNQNTKIDSNSSKYYFEVIDSDKLGTYYYRKFSNKSVRKGQSLDSERDVVSTIATIALTLFAILTASISEPVNASSNKCLNNRGGSRVECRVK